jgi:hypothetical protein
LTSTDLARSPDTYYCDAIQQHLLKYAGVWVFARAVGERGALHACFSMLAGAQPEKSEQEILDEARSATGSNLDFRK